MLQQNVEARVRNTGSAARTRVRKIHAEWLIVCVYQTAIDPFPQVSEGPRRVYLRWGRVLFRLHGLALIS